MLQESPHWPPPMPSEESVRIAGKMFFKHLRSLAEDRVRSKFGQALLRSINGVDRACITVDEDCMTQDLLVNISIQRDVRRKVDGIFKGAGEMTFELDPDIVAEALNSLPEDFDLQVLADFLAAQFIEFRQNYSSEFVQVRDQEHPEGRPLNPTEIENLERHADAQCDKMRLLYRAMLQRNLAAPKPPEA